MLSVMRIGLPLINLVATKLFEVASDMADQGYVQDDSTDEHDQRDCKHEDRKEHAA